MRKIVVINGSPRKKGYTMQMVNMFEESLGRLDNDIEFEYINLIDSNLKFCIGCCECLKQGGHKCPLKDDGRVIHHKILNADGIVLSAPGYSHAISGLFKNFLDRFMYQDHLPEYVGKPTMIICTSGAEGVNNPPKYIDNKAASWWGCNIVDAIGISSAFYVANEKYRNKTIKLLNKCAKNFHAELNRTQQKNHHLSSTHISCSIRQNYLLHQQQTHIVQNTGMKTIG